MKFGKALKTKKEVCFKVPGIVKYLILIPLVFLFLNQSPVPSPQSPLSFAGEIDTHSGPTQSNELPSGPMPNATGEFVQAGKEIYEFRCAPCHGFSGKGDGPAAMTLDPRPRDFTRGLFKFKSTPSGEVVADEDQRNENDIFHNSNDLF